MGGGLQRCLRVWLKAYAVLSGNPSLTPSTQTIPSTQTYSLTSVCNCRSKRSDPPGEHQHSTGICLNPDTKIHITKTKPSLKPTPNKCKTLQCQTSTWGKCLQLLKPSMIGIQFGCWKACLAQDPEHLQNSNKAFIKPYTVQIRHKYKHPFL